MSSAAQECSCCAAEDIKCKKNTYVADVHQRITRVHESMGHTYRILKSLCFVPFEDSSTSSETEAFYISRHKTDRCTTMPTVPDGQRWPFRNHPQNTVLIPAAASPVAHIPGCSRTNAHCDNQLRIHHRKNVKWGIQQSLEQRRYPVASRNQTGRCSHYLYLQCHTWTKRERKHWIKYTENLSWRLVPAWISAASLSQSGDSARQC